MEKCSTALVRPGMTLSRYGVPGKAFTTFPGLLWALPSLGLLLPTLKAPRRCTHCTYRIALRLSLDFPNTMLCSPFCLSSLFFL